MTVHQEIDPDQQLAVTPDELLGMLMSILSDGLDHPELWDEIPSFCEVFPDFLSHINRLIAMESNATSQALLELIKAVTLAVEGDFDAAFSVVEPLALKNSQSAVVQGALFRVKSLRDRIMRNSNSKAHSALFPFNRWMCWRPPRICAAPVGCTPLLVICKPMIGVMSGTLPPQRPFAKACMTAPIVIATKAPAPKSLGVICQQRPKRQSNHPNGPALLSKLLEGPETVNLAYDRTCTLACPSCRNEKYAADSATRERFTKMQDANILPMLKDTG